MKIPFSSLPADPDSAFPDRSELKRPIVALLLANGDHQVVVFAVVDSGADVCVFPASVAEQLGISLPSRRISAFSGSGDTSQTAYFEHVEATILPMDAPGIEPDQPPMTFPLYAGFCESMEHIGMGLLGNDGFFSRFAVSFHHARSYFEIL
jgi:hypothetical protein